MGLTQGLNPAALLAAVTPWNLPLGSARWRKMTQLINPWTGIPNGLSQSQSINKCMRMHNAWGGIQWSNQTETWLARWQTERCLRSDNRKTTSGSGYNKQSRAHSVRHFLAQSVHPSSILSITTAHHMGWRGGSRGLIHCFSARMHHISSCIDNRDSSSLTSMTYTKNQSTESPNKQTFSCFDMTTHGLPAVMNHWTC